MYKKSPILKLRQKSANLPTPLKAKTKSAFQPYIGSEKDFQKSVARYLDSLGVLWNHAANERKSKVKQNKKGDWYSPEGAILKQMGVKKGFPDVMLYEYGRCGLDTYHGFAIELKVGSNKPTKEQLGWQAELRERGWRAEIYYSLDKLIVDVGSYLIS